ncbi:hypothetical protein D6817_03725, partial [Candidatus Pacearchaeota archaeon]
MVWKARVGVAEFVEARLSSFRASAFAVGLALFALLGAYLIIAQPPELYTLQGYVFHSDGTTQVPAGTTVTINATQSGSFVQTQTSGPPGQTGFYSASFNASANEQVIVTAFNATMFVRDTAIMPASPSVVEFNLTLNTTRPAETNTTITSPADNSRFDKLTVFNVSFTVEAIGGADSTACNSTISFTNESVVNVTSNSNKSILLGDIALGTTKSGKFEVRANNEGNTQIKVTTRCSSDGESFENSYYDTINVAVAQQPPQLHVVQGYVFHSDGTTQVPAGTTVTINATQSGSFVQTQTSGPPGQTGFYSATINAYDGELVVVYSANGTYEGNASVNLLEAPSVTLVNLSLDTKIVPVD